MTVTIGTRRIVFGAVLMLSAAFAAGGLVGARWIESPQEAAANRAAPAPSVLTATVSRRVLTDTLVTRGDVVVGRRLAVPIVASGEATSVVTGVLVRKGQVLRAGQAAIEVSGRPVVLLRGNVPAYRDLRPGATGRDVRQVQVALQELGFGTGSDPVGVLRSGTQEALRRLYARMGYDVATAGTPAEIDAGRDGVKQATRARASAQRTLDRALAAGRRAGGGPEQRQVVEDARLALDYAEEDLAEARRALARILATSGPMLPLSELTFVPAFPATVATVDVAVGSPGNGTAMTLDMGVPHIVMSVDPQRRGLIREGLAAKVLLLGRSKEIDATITAIGEEVDDGQGGLAHRVRISPREPLPRSAVGDNVRVSVRTASTKIEVLVVPLSALTTSADGATTVAVLEEDGQQRRVPVVAKVSAQGFIEVDPLVGEDLVEGDEVVVGDH